jgi:amino-acid N-acetyltransferase
VTDEQALTVVKHAGGALRVEIEALLSQGLPNSPMARAGIRVVSGNYITARPIGVRKGIDFQFHPARCARSMRPRSPRSSTSPTSCWCRSWAIRRPAKCSTSPGRTSPRGVAVALKADKLLMYTDKLPTNRKGDVVSELTADEALTLSGRKGNLTPTAMRALEHVARAVDNGVLRGHLVTRRPPGSLLLELFTHAGVGTMITDDTVEKLRPARIEDVRGMLELIEPLEAEGTLVKRSRELLEAEIGNFLVIEHDNRIVGCAALYPFPDDKAAEFACLAVAPGVREAGHGERLLKACEERAKSLKLRRLFALTTHAAHWFVEQGFRAAEVAALPEKRQEMYNWRAARRSSSSEYNFAWQEW